jgi:hypothetical protein
MVAGPNSSDDTIRINVLSESTMHGVFAHQPHDDPHWGNEKIINNSQDNPRVDRSEQMTDLHPPMMNLFQSLWNHRPKGDEQAAEDHRPKARRFSSKHHGPQADHRENAADNETELP